MILKLPMKTILSLANPADVETECLVVVALDQAAPKNGPHKNSAKDKPEISLATSDAAIKDAAKDVIASGEIAGKLAETNLLHKPAKLKAKRLLVIGGGKAKTFTSVELRKLAGTAARFLKPKGIRSFAFVAPEGVLTDSDAVKSIIEGAFVGNFDPDTYKSDRKDQQIDALTVVARGDQARLQQALDEGRIIGESQNFTRELVNEPGNRMTPTMLAERARKMAEEVGLKCEVFGPDKIKELKMGAFWSVAQGSDEPPALIVLRYEPAGAPEKPVLGLVGKGVTFDTGGISIKPADGMEKMKYDMAGGAAMIGAMRGIALLKPKVKVTAIICATENMPSGKAQKPGDVQIAMSGKSIEIINTDAEGRLVLADGLYYARQLGCTHLIDAATLTGAVVVALGYVNAGVFASDDKMYERFTKALAKAGEKFWRMPLDEEYKESIRSGIADIINSGGRWGGAITAAMFLKEFAEDTPWMHLDIAGTAWTEENKPWMAKGPSGIAVRSLVEFARDFAE
ncbi:MAG: Leucyl aminopeptidase [Acidobacteriaceae bacterium]|jgi:leucyl aminopeptidase|nr:Leucyl aminopeptidase [Acidobacteriaceae bacterium]